MATRDLPILALVVLLAAALAHAQVVSLEFDAFPIDEGWELFQKTCDAEVWLENGWYHQQLDFDVCRPPFGGQDVYTRSAAEFVGSPRWFYEFRIQATGPSSEFVGNAPAALTAFNSFGITYLAIVSSDLIKLTRDVLLPDVYVDVIPGVPNTVRLELHNDDSNTYAWYVNNELVDQDKGEGPFPVQDTTVTWYGRAWHEPTDNTWDYVRYGVIPIDGLGDFDSDGEVNDKDYYFFEDCINNSGPDLYAGPGCTWADMDQDGDVDFHDFRLFQISFHGE